MTSDTLALVLILEELHGSVSAGVGVLFVLIALLAFQAGFLTVRRMFS